MEKTENKLYAKLVSNGEVEGGGDAETFPK
jgi:hypothetical protein